MLNSDMQILAHIQRHCRRISETVERVGSDFAVFSADAVFVDAVCLNILQIGELAHSLSSEYRKLTEAAVPWKDIIGIRNIVAHHYGAIDVDRIWESAINDVPELDEFCERQLGDSYVHGFNFDQQT